MCRYGTLGHLGIGVRSKGLSAKQQTEWSNCAQCWPLTTSPMKLSIPRVSAPDGAGSIRVDHRPAAAMGTWVSTAARNTSQTERYARQSVRLAYGTGQAAAQASPLASGCGVTSVSER